MKKLNKYLMLFVATFALVGCVDDVFETPSTETSAKVGDEVQFGLTLPSVRTVYGNEINNTFPIYWVENDKVQIFSPDALEGRNNAEYKVIPTTDEGVANTPYYADDLVITGANGVQWGKGYAAGDKVGLHDFYSIYPSGNYTFEKKDGKMLVNGVSVAKGQSITYVGDQTSFNNGFQHEMSNCLMYAYTPGAAMADGVVNLKYKPISTVLEFELGAEVSDDATIDDEYQIFGITLTATSTIAGTFNLDVTNGAFGNWVSDHSKEIDITVSDITSGKEVPYTIKGGKSIKIPVFLAPADLNIDGWVISINTSLGSYTKTLKNSDTNNKTKLEAGQIHKIILPELTPTNKGWDVSTWMKYIPRNVYLSEISIPGSWNSLNKDYQGSNANINKQYAKGVRAFHLDARWQSKSNGAFGNISQSGLTISGLSVCDGSTSYIVKSGLSSVGRVNGTAAAKFQTRLADVVRNVKSDEYMILFCTFAQDSYTGSKCPTTWMQAVSDACDIVNTSDDTSLSGKIYDGNNLSANTLVGDVLGKVIVIVNCENAIANEKLPANSKCLFVHIPNNLTADYFPTSGFKSDNLHYYSGDNVDITMAVSQAQITSSTNTAYPDGERGYYPTFAQRTTVVNNILNWSKENYSDEVNYGHNKWIFLGLGGGTASSKSSDGDSNTSDDVLNEYAPLIDARIDAMEAANDFYPVGIVYLNYTVSGSYTENNKDINSEDTVKKILMLNNQYPLRHDPTKDKYGNKIEGDNTTEGEEGGF